MKTLKLSALLSAFTLASASCTSAATGENNGAISGNDGIRMEPVAEFDEPWAMAFDAGTGILFVTERKGTIRFRHPDGTMGEVSGVPKVDYGGQGGLGDFVFAPGQSRATLDKRQVYLSWAEAGDGDTRGGAVGRAEMVCPTRTKCSLQNLAVIWRQVPKVTGRGHYSHRIAFSPDGKCLFVSSGDRQKMDPAQDLGTNLGKIVRLLLDGTPAPGNPFADRPSPTNQIWSYGHRNVLGLAFAPDGRLWDLEHGPRGGDEINLVEPGKNYGWPLVSDGDHYDGKPIPRHATRPDLSAPAISWNPVIAPGDMIFYSGKDFPAWRGQVLIAAMSPSALVRVSIDGTTAKEVARTTTEHRLRDIAQAPDGTLWVIEDGEETGAGRLMKVVPAS